MCATMLNSVLNRTLNEVLNMADQTVHKGYRLPASLVDRVGQWADDHGVSQAEAVRRLLVAALDGEAQDAPAEPGDAGREDSDAESDTVRALREHVLDLRATIATLTAQAGEKDEQLRAALGLADHAQALQAAQAAQARALIEAATEPRPGVLERVRRWWAGDPGREG